MKAIRVERHGGPEVLELREVPDPEPSAGQVRIRVHAAGVNPVDTYIRAGQQGYAAKMPYTPGMDAAGVVDAVGQGVTRVAAGDRVYTNMALTGAYAELALAPAEHVHRLPERASFAQGAAVGIPYLTAYRALFQRARLQPGESLLVHGASGGVGTAAVQLGRAAGATVIGTAGTEEGLRSVTAQGAHHALDHRSADYLTKVRELTGGRGVDVIAEMLANVNLVKDFDALARYGRIVVIGSRGSLEFEPRLTMRLDASVLGMSLGNTPPEELARAHAAVGAGLENGTLRPVVGRELPLAEAAKAHELVLQRGALGKIVLVA
ncbi:MAG: NADPH:quinone reductase [Thermodesulfobacteriota bacterium]